MPPWGHDHPAPDPADARPRDTEARQRDPGGVECLDDNDGSQIIDQRESELIAYRDQVDEVLAKAREVLATHEG